MAENTAPKQLRPFAFKPGQSGNPAGKPKGSRNKLGEAFIEDLHADWKENGKDTLRLCRIEDPATYCRIVASLLPKEHLHKVSDPLDDLSDEDLEFGLATIRAARKSVEDRDRVRAESAQEGGAGETGPVH